MGFTEHLPDVSRRVVAFNRAQALTVGEEATGEVDLVLVREDHRSAPALLQRSDAFPHKGFHVHALAVVDYRIGIVAVLPATDRIDIVLR